MHVAKYLQTGTEDGISGRDAWVSQDASILELMLFSLSNLITFLQV